MSDAAGHRTVLLNEAIDGLAPRAEGIYVDATFGRGGHSRELLKRLGPRGRLIAIDRDPDAVKSGRAISDSRFALHHAAFSELAAVLVQAGLEGAAGVVDGVLLDLGVSSPQIDVAARGFSFRQDGPLDMRMDTTRGETAADWLARADEKDIAEVIKKNGEERFAVQIAKKVVAARSGERIARTRQLAALVAQAVRSREPGQDPATRTFQALRIHVNRELEELSLILPLAFDALRGGGRLVVISFHSLEDRMVKRFMRDRATPLAPPKGVPVRAAEIPPAPARLVGRAIRASMAEIAENPRSRSAVLRVLEKLH
ncbi:MAG TPA: 16S rRNA (cytosine(1402)-N(4))-methyltransferase RsmH [Rhodocyclaceae bacterium]